MSTTLVQSYLLPLLQSIRSKILAVEDDSGDDSIIQWWTRMLVHTPLFNNILVCLVTIFYGKLGLLGVAWLMQRVGGGGGSIGSARMVALPIAGRSTALHHLYSKQLVYMLLAMSLLFWPLYDTSDWSWRLNAVFPTAMMIRFIIKGAISKDAQDSEVQTLSRSSSPSELLFGPLQFAAVLACCGLFCFMTTEAAIVMATIGIGDAMAPIVGSLYGRHLYRVLPILGPTKTMEGSVCGVFLGTCMGIYFFLYALGLPQTLPLRVVLVYAAMAAVVEGTSPGNMDNLAVPIVLHLFMDRVPQWLP